MIDCCQGNEVYERYCHPMARDHTTHFFLDGLVYEECSTLCDLLSDLLGYRASYADID